VEPPAPGWFSGTSVFGDPSAAATRLGPPAGLYIKDRRIGRAEFSEVFAPRFSRPSLNKALKVELRDLNP
jgi:hypothetical protein